MLGLVAYHIPGADEPLLREIGGVRFCAAYLTPGETLRARLSVLLALRRFHREGVRRAVFPEDCPCAEEFARRGVMPVSAAPLYRAMADTLARRYLEQRGVPLREASLLLAAERVTPELARAARSLSAEARSVALAVPRGGGEALARELRRESGTVLRLVPPGEPTRADLTVAFGAAPAAGNVLRLDEGLKVEFDSTLSPPLLAALWEAGGMEVKELGSKILACARTNDVCAQANEAIRDTYT